MSFQFLLGYSLMIIRAKNLLDFADFDQNVIFRTQHIPIFHFSALLMRTR